MPKFCAYFAFHGGNKDYFEKGLLTAVRSLTRTNPGLPVFVLHDGLSSSETDQLRGCELMLVDASPFHNTHRPDLTIGSFFKLYAGCLADFERVLYLDSDLVVLDKLDEIFSFPGVIAARRERHPLSHEFAEPDNVRRREGLSDESSLMNSGVMCLDPKFWASQHLLGQALDIARDYGWAFFNHADQGILNILSHRYGRFTELPRKFNYCVWPDIVSSRFSHLQRNEAGYLAPMILSRSRQRLLALGIPGPWKRGPLAKVLHWNGPVKPWHDDKTIEEKYRCFLNVYGQF